MTREDYIRALENIRALVKDENRIHVAPWLVHKEILAEIEGVMPEGQANKPAKYGEYEQCSACCHTPRYCRC